jgi:hypothetical protein
MITAEIAQERKLVTAIPGPKSQELHKKKLQEVSHGVGTLLPVYIDRAHGAILVDVDGNQLIDLGSGIGVVTIGHTNQQLVDAVIEQVQNIRCHHAHFINNESAREEPAAQHLVLPGQFTNIGCDFRRGLLAETNARPTVNCLCLFAEEQGRTARERRDGNLIAFILKFLFDLLDEIGFASASWTCQEDFVAFKDGIQSNLLTLIERHLFRVV